MEESGVLSHLREKWFDNREYSADHLCQRTEESKGGGSIEHQPVVWQSVTDLFWLLMAGVIVCVLLALFEKCVS